MSPNIGVFETSWEKSEVVWSKLGNCMDTVLSNEKGTS